MKHLFFLLFFFVFIFQSCGPKIVGFADGTSEGEYQIAGKKLADAWDEDANREAAKQEKGSKRVRAFGYVSTGLGIIGGVVAAGLDDDAKAGLSYGISIASAVIGVIQLANGTKEDVEKYVVESRKAIADYRTGSGTEKQKYTTLTNEFNRIRKDTKIGNFTVK